MTSLNPDVLKEVLTGLGLIVVLAMLMERALAVVYEWGPLERVLTERKLRAPLAYLTAYLICVEMKFDMLMVMANEPVAVFNMFSVGTLVTAGTIAGGSKGAMTLFQDVLGFAKESTSAAAGVGAQVTNITPSAPSAAQTPPAARQPTASVG